MTRISTAQAKEEITALLLRWVEAVGEHDSEFFEQVMDDGWQYTDYTGTRRGKADYIQLIQVVKPGYVEDFKELEFRVVADAVALVTGSYHARAELVDGGVIEADLAFSAVWERRGGRWYALLHHSTSLPPAS